MPLSVRRPDVRFGRGRRLSDPPDRPPAPDTLAVRGRLAGVSVRASIAAGAWVGFALGLAIGTGIGALFVWFAGSVVDWQRDLAFTFGVAQRLLPFGDQLGLLRSIRASWYFVIPGIGVLVGASSAMIGGLIGGLIAVTYNRSPRHGLVIVELPREVVAPATSLAGSGDDLAGAISTPEPFPAETRPTGKPAMDAVPPFDAAPGLRSQGPVPADSPTGSGRPSRRRQAG